MAEQKADYETESWSEQLLCALPEVVERELDPNIDPHRALAIRPIDKQWVNRTVLHYYFFDRATDGRWVGAADQQQAVRDAFQTWKDLDIGLVFEEVGERQEAEAVSDSCRVVPGPTSVAMSSTLCPIPTDAP